MLNDAGGFEKIYIAVGYTDLRRGIDGLASTIKFQFNLDPFPRTLLFTSFPKHLQFFYMLSHLHTDY